MTSRQQPSRAVILVVDDEPVVRMCVAAELEASGFDVVEAESADDALGALETRQDVRAIFTDINMPGRCDGLELVRAVHERWPEVRLVVTSGRVRPNDDDLPDAGRFIPKPYAPETVANVLRDLIQ
jgi:two-component system, response regulator PdtaR